MAASLKYNRGVNINGGLGCNIAGDLALEFLNKKCKEHLSNCGVITDNVLTRVGNSIGPLKILEENTEHELQFYSSIGRRVHPSYSQDIYNIVSDLRKYDLFKNSPGRFHQAFPYFRKDKMTSINGEKLNTWISKRKELLAKEERLRYLKP
jgi:hypothetical protein